MISLILAAAMAAPAPAVAALPAAVPAAKAKGDCCCDKSKSAKAAMPGMSDKPVPAPQG